MKAFISSAILAILLTSPAYANKTPTKPENACAFDNKTAWMLVYNLDQMQEALNEMRSVVNKKYPQKPLNKPVQNNKTEKKPA